MSWDVLTVRVSGCSITSFSVKNKKRFPNDVLSECPALYIYTYAHSCVWVNMLQCWTKEHVNCPTCRV